MATNLHQIDLGGIKVAVTDPTIPASGDVVRYGDIVGIALNDEDSDGNTVVDFRPSVYNVSVLGADDDGNVAVVAGEQLYYADADDGILSRKQSGYYAGIALEAVDSAATTTIMVAMAASVGPGSSQIPAGSIGTSELAAGGPGYVTGDGGAVTQLTDDSTAVTLSTRTGQITTVALTLAAGVATEFTVTNTEVVATDIVSVSTTYAGGGTPQVTILGVGAGSFVISITNIHASAALDALMVINFAVIAGVAA